LVLQRAKNAAVAPARMVETSRWFSIQSLESVLNQGPNFSGASLSIPALRKCFGNSPKKQANSRINKGIEIKIIALSLILNIIRYSPEIKKDQHPAPKNENSDTVTKISTVAYNRRQFIICLRRYAHH
jgi:hypothetical protein